MSGINVQRLAAAGTKIGMNLAGNSKVDVILHIATGRAYDATNDVTTNTATDIPVEAFFYMDKEAQTPQLEVSQKQFSPNTRTLLIEAAKLPAGTVITEADTVTMEAKLWQILDVDRPPGKAMWILNIRK